TGYSNQTPIVPLTGDQSIFGTGGAIFDDALISGEMNPTGAPIQVTSITFGLVRDRNAPSMALSAYCGTPTTTSPYPVLNSAASLHDVCDDGEHRVAVGVETRCIGKLVDL